MFKRFTERARQAVVFGQDEARLLHHGHIGTEHLLLGLLRVEDGFAAHLLGELGVTLEGARVRVRDLVPATEGAPPAAGEIQFTPGAKKALELALREAMSFGQGYIGTEHLLLGIARESATVAAQILPPAVKQKVVERLTATHAIQKTRRFRRGPAFGGGVRPQWEYRVEESEHIEASWLNALGAEGWMLAGVSGSTLIFQRACGPSSELRVSA